MGVKWLLLGKVGWKSPIQPGEDRKNMSLIQDTNDYQLSEADTPPRETFQQIASVVCAPYVAIKLLFVLLWFLRY